MRTTNAQNNTNQPHCCLLLGKNNGWSCMCGSKKVLSGTVQFRQPFIVDVMRMDQNIAQSGPSSAHQWHTIEKAFRWAGGWWPNIECWLGYAGNPDQLCQEILYFYDFSGGGPDPCPPCPPLDPRMSCFMQKFNIIVNLCHYWYIAPQMEHSFSFLKFYMMVSSPWKLYAQRYSKTLTRFKFWWRMISMLLLWYLVKINNLVFVGMKISV